jgi:small-conductance mechanosensitive channel
LTFFVVLIFVLFIWVRNLTFITAITGFLAAGLAIALRDVIMSLFGWFKIIVSRPFKVGDRIQVQDLEGDVIDITFLHTVLLEVGNWVKARQSTGRIVFVSNHILFTASVYNSTHGFPYLWDEFHLVVTFESDLQKARELMEEPIEEVIGINDRRARQEIQKMRDRYAIRYENISARTYTSIDDHGVELTLRYLTRVRDRREIKSRLSRKIMELISEHPEVELAYPTYRIYRKNEGDLDHESSDPDDLDTTDADQE